MQNNILESSTPVDHEPYQSEWVELTNAEIDEAAELIPDQAVVTESHGMLTAVLAYVESQKVLTCSKGVECFAVQLLTTKCAAS